MPLKRSNRVCNPSGRAVAIAAGGEPPQKKSRRVAVQPNPTNQDSSVASTDQSATLTSTAPVGPQPISLSSGTPDQLVAWVADEVTCCLSPANKTSSTPINNTSRPSVLSEVLLVSNPPPPDGGVPVPGTSTATPIVIWPLRTTQGSLSGESQVPTVLFSSPSPLIDARVYLKNFV